MAATQKDIVKELLELPISRLDPDLWNFIATWAIARDRAIHKAIHDKWKATHKRKCIELELTYGQKLSDLTTALCSAVSIVEDKLDYRPDDTDADEWAQVKSALPTK